MWAADSQIFQLTSMNATRTLTYSGVDLSENMIREAKRCLPNVDVQVGNVLDMEGNRHR